MMLVSPGYFNKQGHWCMEPLQEIWRGRLADTGNQIEMYGLANGGHYIDGHFRDVELSEISDLACLASFVT